MGLVDQIIAAKKNYDETDRVWLSKLADGQLKKIAASCGCAEATPDPAPAPVATPPAAAATPPEANPTASTAAAPSTTSPAVTPVATPPAAAPAAAAVAPEPPLTAEQWIEKTPPHLQGVFGDLLAQRRAEETELRGQIVAQSGGKLTAEYLANKPLDELKTQLAALRAAAGQADYSGRGMSAGDPIAQAGRPASPPRMPGIKIGGGAAAA